MNSIVQEKIDDLISSRFSLMVILSATENSYQYDLIEETIDKIDKELKELGLKDE